MTSRSVKDKPIKLIDLKDLRLDANNPRFAEHTSDAGTQRDIVNIIVRQFGVDDVLSSIAVSGYFSAEPLVCKPGKEGEYVVVEGNRRLVAMLLLSDHSDARDHRIRIQKFREIHRQHGEPAFSPAPAVIFEDDDSQKALLSYLGVRHIVSTKPWDSFAKAAWVATALRESHLNLDDIAEMIGDSRQTVKKLLSGYHFIKQLEESGEFSPDNSTRKGRGSNTKYPFSWIYTILGNPVAKKFVSLSEEPTNHKPVPEEYLRNAGLMVRAMFGDNSEGLNPAIDDSRQLTDLAKILANPTKVAYLRQGKSVEEILRLTQPIEELLGSALVEILNGLRAVTARLDEDDLATETASELHGSTQSIKKQATKLEKQVSDALQG